MTKRKLRSRSEAGHKGGTRTKARYGKAHFQRIGALGGKVKTKQLPANMVFMSQAEHEKHHRGEGTTQLFDHKNPETKNLRPLP